MTSSGSRFDPTLRASAMPGGYLDTWSDTQPVVKR